MKEIEIKEKIFAEEVLKTGDIKEAYKKICEGSPKEESIRVNAYNYLQREGVKTIIEASLDEAGLTLPYLNNRLRVLTTSTNESISLESLKTAYKLRKLLDSNAQYTDARQVNITIDSPEALNKTIDSLKTLNEALKLNDIQDGEIINDKTN